MGRAKAATPQKGKMRKVKKPKDKNAPKKPTTAFFYFVKHRRDQKCDQGMKVSEFTKECGALWRESLSAAEKGKFEKLADTDKQRYLKEMQHYKPTGGSSKGGASGDEPPKPKRPATAFLLYANAQRKKLSDDGLNQKEVLVEAGRLWKEMEDDEKAEWNEAAAEEKKKYDRQMEKYNDDIKHSKKNAQNGAKKAAPKDESDEEDEEDDEDDDDDVDSDDE